MTTRVEHRIGIAAPVDAVWDVLSDFARWGEWNAVHPEFNGRLAIGGGVDFVETVGGKTRRLAGVIEDWVPMDQIHIRVARGPLNRSLRYFEIEKLAETGCILSNGELYDGFIGARWAKFSQGDRFRAFRDLNEAMKRRAEQLWADRRGDEQPDLL